MINNIFQKLLHKKVLASYMDDFVIPAKTIKELEEQTTRFLKIIEKHNLYFKQSKCDFNMEEIPILGVVVGKVSRLKNIDLVFSLFSFSFYFLFSIFRTLGLGLEVIGHMVIPVTTDSIITTLIMELKRRK